MISGEKHLPPPASLAVADTSRARVPGQFRMTIEPGREWVRHEVVAWSVGLRWLTFVFHGPVLNASSPLFLQGRDEEYLRSVEQQPTEQWLQKVLGRHMETHEGALLQGLTPGGENDLPAERVMIDRLLKEMVEREGIDVHGPAAIIATNDDYLQLCANNQEYMGTYVGDRHFQLRQLGRDLPVMSTWLPLGRANYCGHALDLDHPLPEVICNGVVGRRLGSLVATGIPELDDRIITEVVTADECVMDHMPPSTETRLYLESDLVELGG